ncbi:MAG: TrmH family RNA methyltransferase [Oscillospiraceae bacterium]|nr:TrmH family RNA methyltransferase [Oscillospiraceae bacterium]
MNPEIKLRTYKKELDYSYALGASPVIELLQNRPGDCFRIIFSPLYSDRENKIKNLCGKYKILCEENQRLINILSPKENCYVIAAFKKRRENIDLDLNKSHIILDNPSDMGNLGTIIRSCAGFGIENIAVIGAGADAYNPKVIRSSMGAFFRVNIKYFKSVYDYLDIYGEGREIYTFTLNADYSLSELEINKKNIYSLIFGNESSGLDYNIYKKIGRSIIINHSDKIDSLNLPVAVGVALFWFNK